MCMRLARHACVMVSVKKMVVYDIDGRKGTGSELRLPRFRRQSKGMSRDSAFCVLTKMLSFCALLAAILEFLKSAGLEVLKS